LYLDSVDLRDQRIAMHATRTQHARALHGAVPTVCPALLSIQTALLGGHIVDVIATWTGGLAATLRAADRMTIEEFADKLGIGARTVAKWEADPAFVPPLSMQQVLDVALERAPVNVKTRFDLLRDSTLPTHGSRAAERRHQVETGNDEVASAMREAEAEQLVLLEDPAPETIETLGERAAEVARAGNRRPDAIFRDSHRIRGQALTLIQQTHQPGVLSDLYMIAGQASALMASAAFDLDRWDASAALARSAVSYARLVGDASLHAWTLGLVALLANWRDEPDIALDHFQRGLQVAPAGTPRVRLRHIAARSYALLGDSASVGTILGQARRDQDDAGRFRDRLSEDTGGEFAFGHARADACAAAAWLDVGRGLEAKDAAQRALNDFTALPPGRRPRSQSLGARIDLATGCLLRRELDEAEEALGEVLSGHTAPVNVSLSGRLAKIRRVLAAPVWVEDPAAQRLDSIIGDLLAEQPSAVPPPD
jgi:transcriptional regulator with XRE-family HTH domain